MELWDIPCLPLEKVILTGPNVTSTTHWFRYTDEVLAVSSTNHWIDTSPTIEQSQGHQKQNCTDYRKETAIVSGKVRNGHTTRSKGQEKIRKDP